MQEGIDFFSHTLPVTQCSTGNGNIQWATHTTFCVAKHFFHRFSHRDIFNPTFTRALFFLLSRHEIDLLQKRVKRVCLFVIFIPNEILGGKIILTKNTDIRIQKVWLEFGCSKMERVQHQLWANEYDRFDHYRCGTSPSILQQSIVLLALRKKNALPLRIYKISRQLNRK